MSQISVSKAFAYHQLLLLHLKNFLDWFLLDKPHKLLINKDEKISIVKLNTSRNYVFLISHLAALKCVYN